jgi:hypothetical protein
MRLAALCRRHSSADFTIGMYEFDFRQAQELIGLCRYAFPLRKTRKARPANCHHGDRRPCTRRIQASYYFRILPILRGEIR